MRRASRLMEDHPLRPGKVQLLHALRYETDYLDREELIQQLRDSDSWRGGW